MLNTHAEATFQIPDVTKVLAVPDLLKLYMQPAVVAMAERIETDISDARIRSSPRIRRVGTAGVAADGSDGGLGGDGAVSGEGAGGGE